MGLSTLLVLLFFPFMCIATETPSAPMTFDEASAAAKQANRLMLVCFLEAGHPLCESYREHTWSDQDVKQWVAEHVTAVEVEGDEQSALRKRFDVRVVPAVLLVSPDGAVRVRLLGFRDPQVLLNALTSALQASDPVVLAQRRLEEDSDNLVAELGYAKALEQAGRFDDALQRYLACFDRDAEQSSSFGGTQLVVVDELGRLAAMHPPAQKALIQRRDDSRRRILAGQGRRTDPAVFAAANARLGALDDTLAVYEKIRKEYPGDLTTRLLRECAVDSALELKEYDRVAALIDIVQHADRVHGQYLQDLKKPIPSGTAYEQFKAFERRAFIEGMVKFYEMLIGVGRTDDATHLASIVTQVDDGTDGYYALARAALRTGRPGEINADQARKAVELAGSPRVDMLSTWIEILILLDRRTEAARAVIEHAQELDDPADREALKQLLTTRRHADQGG